MFLAWDELAKHQLRHFCPKFQTNSSWNLSSQFAWLIHSSTLVSCPQTASQNQLSVAGPLLKESHRLRLVYFVDIIWFLHICLPHVDNVRQTYAKIIGGTAVRNLSGGKNHVRICLAYLSVQVPSTCLSVRCILSSHDLNAKERRVRIPIVIMMLRTNSSWNLSSQFAWLIRSSTLVSCPQTASQNQLSVAGPLLKESHRLRLVYFVDIIWFLHICLPHVDNVRQTYAKIIGGTAVRNLSGGKNHVRICLAYLSVQVPSTCLSVRCILSSHDLNAKERRVRIPIVIMMLRTNSSWNLSSQFAWLIHSSTLVSCPRTASQNQPSVAGPLLKESHRLRLVYFVDIIWFLHICLPHVDNVRQTYAKIIGGTAVRNLSGGKNHVRTCLYLSVQVPSTCLSVRCILSSHDLNAKERRVRIPIVIMMLRTNSSWNLSSQFAWLIHSSTLVSCPQTASQNQLSVAGPLLKESHRLRLVYFGDLLSPPAAVMSISNLYPLWSGKTHVTWSMMAPMYQLSPIFQAQQSCEICWSSCHWNETKNGPNCLNCLNSKETIKHITSKQTHRLGFFIQLYRNFKKHIMNKMIHSKFGSEADVTWCKVIGLLG